MDGNEKTVDAERRARAESILTETVFECLSKGSNLDLDYLDELNAIVASDGTDSFKITVKLL